MNPDCVAILIRLNRYKAGIAEIDSRRGTRTAAELMEKLVLTEQFLTALADMEAWRDTKALLEKVAA
jgi:predicted transcriptional regulator